MDIQFAGGAYEQPISNVNSQRCVNWFPKYTVGKEENKTTKHLYPTPGLTPLVELGGNKVRGLLEHAGILYAVVDNTLYSVTGSGSYTNLGTIGTVIGSRVYMEVNNNEEIFIGDNTTAYQYDIGTETLSQITDTDFPGVDSASYMDGYVFVVRNGRVYFSDLGDIDSWSANNVFTPSFKADKTRAVITFHEQVICFGDYTTEVYINDGVTPFSRLSRTSMLYGISAKDSLVAYHEGLLFLGKNKLGGNAVCLISKDLEVMQVSPPSINAALNEINVESAFGVLEYTKDGHIHYHLSIPDINKTYTYDILTKEWHERESKKPFTDVDGQNIYGIYRANCSAFFKGNQVVGDIYSGDIFIVDSNIYTEDGQHIRRLRRSKIYTNEQKYTSINSVEFDITIGSGLLTGQGSDPKLMFRASKDGGENWINERLISLGSRGEYDRRPRTYGLGAGRNWVIEVKVTDPIPVAVNTVYVHGEMGAK